MSIFIVGHWCVDIVASCTEYPDEDSDGDCSTVEWLVGGNSCNSSRVVSYLGLSGVQYVGSMCPMDNMLAQFVVTELNNAGVGTDFCTIVPGTSAPTTVVVLNSKTGSRTLMHARGNLRNLTVDNFRSIPLDKAKWIHFQCTHNVSEVMEMMQIVRKTELPLTVSLELEKNRPDSEKLIPFADFVFISKDFARFWNCDTKEEAVRTFSNKVSEKSAVVCAWGADGAAACTSGGEFVTSPAFPPDNVIDTLGAGDTFNGSFIAAVLAGAKLDVALTFACRVAGHKCGNRGFKSVAQFKDVLDGFRTSSTEMKTV